MKIKAVMLGILAFGCIGAANATMITDTWTFTDGGTNTGSGSLTYNSSTGLVSSFSGNYDGNALTFYNASTSPVLPNDPGPGQMTYHGVPNTGGADYVFDDLFPITVNGILTSTGSGAGQVFYDISLDSPGATQVDFFSIAPSGAYVVDDGTFTTTQVAAVPEPSTWALMLLGFCGLGFMAYRKNAAVRFA